MPEASSRWRYVFYLNHIQNKIDAYLHGKRLRPDLAAAAPRKMKFLLDRGMKGALEREVVVEGRRAHGRKRRTSAPITRCLRSCPVCVMTVVQRTLAAHLVHDAAIVERQFLEYSKLVF